jgi:hypothetical protein
MKLEKNNASSNDEKQEKANCGASFTRLNQKDKKIPINQTGQNKDSTFLS